jgi:hypothetical protein
VKVDVKTAVDVKVGVRTAGGGVTGARVLVQPTIAEKTRMNAAAVYFKIL